MQQRQIVILQVVVTAAGFVFAVHSDTSLRGYAWVAFGAVVALGFVRRWLERQHARDLLMEARLEWQVEYGERLEVELARGMTDTMAKFLVQPVMDGRWPENVVGAVLYLQERGKIAGADEWVLWAKRARNRMLRGLAP